MMNSRDYPDPSSWETLGKKLMNEALKHDVDQVEVFISSSRRLIAEIEKNSLKSSQEIIDYGCGLRIIKDGCIGFGFVTNLKWDTLSKMVLQLVHLAKSGTPDPNFKSLPTAGSYQVIPGRHDSTLAAIDVTEAIKVVLEIEKEAAGYSNEVYSVNASFYTSETKCFLLNSLGVEAFDLDEGATSVGISADVTVKRGTDMSSGYDFQHGRFFKILDPVKIGKKAAKLAIETLGSQRIETGQYPIIFHPFALNSILRPAISSAINAESVQYHRSFLTGKLNEQVGCKLLNVIDDGRYVRNGMAALGTSSFDGEGTPKISRQILENGILKTYLHDSYTAGKDGISSTGNAIRSNYGYTPYIGPNNLRVLPRSSKTLDDFIHECDDGILLYTTGDSPNITTGDFSGLIMIGFRILKGSIEHPIKQAMMGINMIDFFNKIEEIGNDVRDLGRFHVPSLRISSAQIAGEKH
ncbi:MAG: TldD/PmbA family protein [Candidatus Helarchaeota archaeon]